MAYYHGLIGLLAILGAYRIRGGALDYLLGGPGYNAANQIGRLVWADAILLTTLDPLASLGAYLGWSFIGHGHYFYMNNKPRAERPNQKDWLASINIAYPKIKKIEGKWKIEWVRILRIPLLDLIKNEYWRDFLGMWIIGTIRSALCFTWNGHCWLILALGIAYPIGATLGWKIRPDAGNAWQERFTALSYGVGIWSLWLI